MDTPEKEEYYCRTVPLRKDYICGLNLYPNVSQADQYGRCDLGSNKFNF